MKKNKLLVACLLGSGIMSAAMAAEDPVCIKNEAAVILKACDSGYNCQDGITVGNKAIFRSEGEGKVKTVNIFYSNGFIYKHWNNVDLRSGQSYIVQGNLFSLSGKIVDKSCPAGLLKKAKN